ncbi:MAG: Tetratricopeptide 2 repeat-containing protein [Daejeonella sp.]|nr:Tetratricopeptide 2 repeat-containing protein [Daejeonella sp.]
MKGFLITLFVFIACSFSKLSGQSITREAKNSYALFTQTNDIQNLSKARKLIDDAYRTKKDSASFKINITRGLIYSTLAHVDSNKTFSYQKDPVEEALFSLGKITNPKFIIEHDQEIAHIHRQLNATYLISGNRAIANRNYISALNFFSKVDSNSLEGYQLQHNLAILYSRVGDREKAIHYYKYLIKKTPQPEYYLALANLYESRSESIDLLNLLQEGIAKFPDNRNLTNKLLNFLAGTKNFEVIANIIDQPLRKNPESVDLNYLAGFSYDIKNQKTKAQEYYLKVLELQPNNYDANYSLGLLYLDFYLSNKNDPEMMLKSKEFLTKAYEIDPDDLKTLKSLSLLYTYNGESDELLRINERINQLKFN